MLVYRRNPTRKKKKGKFGVTTIIASEGWYLFGIFPLYVREVRDEQYIL